MKAETLKDTDGRFVGSLRYEPRVRQWLIGGLGRGFRHFDSRVEALNWWENGANETAKVAFVLTDAERSA